MMRIDSDPPQWRLALTSGLITLALAVAAFLLPVIHWAPRSAVVGWLLVLSGLAEWAFGWRRGRNPLGLAVAGSGLLTLAAGLLFVANPQAGYLPVATIVMAWLLIRGAWIVVTALRMADKTVGSWFALSGVADILLGFALMIGVQVTALVVTLFGPTPEAIARFSLILTASFLMTAVSQVAIALVQRRRWLACG